jgi:hypothetical protein
VLYKHKECGTLQTRQGLWHSLNKTRSVALSKHDKECGTLQTPQGAWHSPKHHTPCGVWSVTHFVVFGDCHCRVWKVPHSLSCIERVPHFVSCLDTTRLVVFGVSHSLRLESATLITFGEFHTPCGVWRVPHSLLCLDIVTVVFRVCHTPCGVCCKHDKKCGTLQTR